MSKPLLLALAGVPNGGKSALFNALTGSRQKVANYAGVTVERKEGSFVLPSGKTVQVLDLPGTYSLNPRTPDEVVTRDALFGKLGNENTIDLVVAVVDATNLQRCLGFVLELRALGKPVVLALNMFDLVQLRGMKLDLEILSRELGVPVAPTVAINRNSIGQLLNEVEKTLDQKKRLVQTIPLDPRQRLIEVDRILKAAHWSPGVPEKWTDRIDRVLLNPVWGVLILGLVLTLMFQAVFNWAGPLQDLISMAFDEMGSLVSSILSDGPLRGLLVNGVIAGVGGVLVFLPQILILFLFILLLEDSGYMARAAFLMDRMMGAVGLHGRAFIPLLSSFACAIPGIMATRTIENRRDRLATILIAPLMTCSARLPVYSLLIAAFIPNTLIWGPLRLQGVVMLALYLMGVFSAVGVAYIFKKLFLRGDIPPLMLELPAYKRPRFRNIAMGLFERAKVFVRRAGTVILSLTVMLWFLASFPAGTQIADSYAGQLGRFIEPVLRPLGFDWRIAVAMVPGFAAREVMVSALATVYAVENGEAGLSAQLIQNWSLATAMSLLVWYIFAPQCLSTFAVMRRETNSWRWPVFGLVYLLLLAYLGSWVTYRVFA